MQDVTRSWKFASLSKDIENKPLTIPHEIGHQFGLLGDQVRQTFQVMDYNEYSTNVVNSVGLHPAHIDILRRRVKSPGQ